MDYTCRVKTLQSISKDIEKELISLSHKLQRQEGQWNKKQKTDLIDSLLRKYPINPSYGIKEECKTSIIDGIQRLSTVRDFLADGFSLSKDMETVTVNGVEKTLAGLKFSNLDEDTKDAILNAELQIYELTDCTEKDVREIFRRQNAGKPLNGKQLRVVHESDSFSETVYSLANHPFMDKLMTKTQRKNGTDRDIIVQTLMLISTNHEHEFVSFKSKDMDAFVKDYADNVSDDKIETLKTAMDKFDEAFDEVKIPITSLPMILYSGYRTVKNKQSFSELIEITTDFLTSYDTNEEYKQYVLNGTGQAVNVRGRYEYWRNLIRTI